MSSSTSGFLFDKDIPARIGDNSKRPVHFSGRCCEGYSIYLYSI
jgi:hypothetical protein